jgi:hypothetical protein
VRHLRPIGIEHPGQGTAATGQPGLDRPGRHPQLTGHLLDRQAHQVVQHDHLPLAQGERAQGVVEVEQLGTQLRDGGRRANSQQRRSRLAAMAARFSATRRTHASGRS